MNRRLLSILFTLIIAASFGCALPSFAQDIAAASETERIAIDSADYLKNERETGLTSLKGGVSFRFRDSTVYADEAVLDEKNKTAVAKNNVRITDTRGDFSGDALFYDYDSEWFEIANGSGSTISEGVSGRVFFTGRIIQGTSKKIKIIGAEFTTCEPQCPREYHMYAKTAVIYPNNKVIARDVYFYMGNTRILYFPVYVASLKQNRRYMPEFGYDNSRGFYALTQYPYLAKELISGWIILDYMSKKGVNYGAEHEYKAKRLGGDGYSKFQTNRETDTGNSSNIAEIRQKLKIGDNIAGNFNFNRRSSYNEYLRGSRINSNTLTLNLTRQIFELKQVENATTKGAQRRTMNLAYNKNTSQSSSGQRSSDDVNFSHQLFFNQRLSTSYNYQFSSQKYSGQPTLMNGRFKSDTMYAGSLYSLAMSLQRTYDLDDDKNLSNNTESLNVMWPKLSLTLQQKLYGKLLPQKFFPISNVQMTSERIRQGPRNKSEGLRRNTFFVEARKTLFPDIKKLNFNVTQSFTQYMYSTQDAEYIMNHTSDATYSFNQRMKLNVNFSSVKDSGGSPYNYSSQREAERLRSSFSINSPSTSFTLSTQYDYRMPPDRRFSPLSISYNRSVSQNSKLTIGGSYDINYSRWGDANTSMEIRRKNTSLRLGALWDTKKFDLRNGSIVMETARKNGWKFNVQSIIERKSQYGFIREIVAKKTRCCTEIEFKYNTTLDLFQFQYVILAFPGKKFGFTESSQGFEVDQSAFKSETTPGHIPGQNAQ